MKKTKANKIRANEPLSQCLYGLMKKTRNYFQDSLEPSLTTPSKVSYIHLDLFPVHYSLSIAIASLMIFHVIAPLMD